MHSTYKLIKETLLKNDIQFAAEHADINKNDFEVIAHARNSFLFHANQHCLIRDNDNFEVIMGAYDDTEICKLVGILTLLLLSGKYIGLYCDNGLSAFRRIIRQDAEKHKK